MQERDPINKGNKAPDFYPQRRRQPNHKGQESQRKPYYQQVRCDIERFPQREYTPLNSVRVYILDEILETRLTQLPPRRGKDHTLGGNLNAWCAYHRCKGLDTEKCFRLRDLIEELIKSGHLRKFLDDAANGKVVVPKIKRNPQRNQGEKSGEEKVRIAVNTIAGGFVGGGESSTARKRYVRRSEFEVKFVGHTSIAPVPDLSFTKEDKREVMPHDDDPLVIQVQILNCDVKIVLMDSGSSADIMYWEAFKVMQLSNEHLMPYNDTLVGFAGEQVEVMGYTTLLTTFGETTTPKLSTYGTW
jgi:hypothetical protein